MASENDGYVRLGEEILYRMAQGYDSELRRLKKYYFKTTKMAYNAKFSSRTSKTINSIIKDKVLDERAFNNPTSGFNKISGGKGIDTMNHIRKEVGWEERWIEAIQKHLGKGTDDNEDEEDDI